MPPIKDHAVILRRLDFSENSQVLVLFARQAGKVRAIAKGVKRSTKTRFAPAMDLLDIGSVVLSARPADRERLAIITEWKPVLPLTGLRDDLARLYAAQYAAALTSELTEDWDPHVDLYDALVESLTSLSLGEPVIVQTVRYQRTLLDEIGSLPDFERCVGCNRPSKHVNDVYFTSFEGGLLCRDCEPSRSEKFLIPRIARRWLLCDADTLQGAFEAFAVLDYHLSHVMGRRLPLSDSLTKLFR